MQRTKWLERKFNFDFPEGWIFNIIERLKGTPFRIIEMTNIVTEERAEMKPDNKWSIKENIGHLGDIEELHIGRINDLVLRKEILRAADITNAKTFNANHNSKTIAELIIDFAEKRAQFIDHIEKLDDETQQFKSLHPRLQVKMRSVDVAFFTAEHDDHHIADMRDILKGVIRK